MRQKRHQGGSDNMNGLFSEEILGRKVSIKAYSVAPAGTGQDHLEIWISLLALSSVNCIYKDRHRDIDISVTTFTCMSVYIALWVDSVIYFADVNFLPDIDIGETCKKAQTHCIPF